MRYSPRLSALQKTKTRIISLTTALVLAVTGMGGAAPLLFTSTAHAETAPLLYVRADGSDTNCNGSADVSDADASDTNCAYATPQKAINSAAAGSTIQVGAGTFSASQFLVLAGKEGLTITGTGATTVFALTAVSDGFKVQANDITLRNFDINGTNTAKYGLRAQGVSDLTVENMSITGMTRSAFDINGVTNSTFTNITAIGNGGNGVSINDSKYLTFTGVTTATNGWGGVALYATGTAYACGTTDVTFSNISLSEQSALYTGNSNPSNPACTIAGINFPSSVLPYVVHLNNNDPKDIYVTSEATAVQVATNPVMAAFSPVIASTDTGNFYVAPGQSIQNAINRATDGSTIEVAPGTYQENVNVSKAVTLISTGGASVTTIVGTNGDATPVTFSSDDATVSGFTITHNYTSSELANWSFNNNGVIFLQGTSGNTLSNSVITLNRNGIYLNNTQNNVITGNTITNNRTGINATNTLNGTQIINNTISNNWTIGLVMYTATATLTTDLSTVDVYDNTFDQNWYTEVLVKDANFSGSLDLTNNTFTDSPVTYSTSSSANLNEPGFAAQKPVGLGDGTAVKPSADLPTLRIYNSPDARIIYASNDLDVSSNEVVLTIDEVVVTVPQNATITPANPAIWNGVVKAPRVVTNGVNLPNGATAGVTIEVGSSDTSLTFDKAAKLVFPGQAGKHVGWQAPGDNTFAEITKDCSIYLPDLDADMPADGDCKTTSGDDLVVWTKHFTTFATFSPAPVTSNNGNSGSSSSNGTAPVTVTTNIVRYASNPASTISSAAETAASILGTSAGTSSDATKKAATTNQKATEDTSKNFLGLGWWWLLVLGAVALVVAYFFAARRSNA